VATGNQSPMAFLASEVLINIRFVNGDVNAALNAWDNDFAGLVGIDRGVYVMEPLRLAAPFTH
jgi:hypothetical protein